MLKPSQTCCDSIQMPPAKATADDDEALFKRVQVVKALQRVDWGWAFEIFERLAVILMAAIPVRINVSSIGQF